MAKSSQFTSVSSSSGVGGNTQAVVELCGACGRGLILWARRRFHLGAELQVRLRTEALPPFLQGLGGAPGAEWLILRVFVVACQAQRRADGSCGFRVSVLMEDWAEGQVVSGFGLCQDHLFFCHEWLGGHRLGFN